MLCVCVFFIISIHKRIHWNEEQTQKSGFLEQQPGFHSTQNPKQGRGDGRHPPKASQIKVGVDPETCAPPPKKACLSPRPTAHSLSVEPQYREGLAASRCCRDRVGIVLGKPQVFQALPVWAQEAGGPLRKDRKPLEPLCWGKKNPRGSKPFLSVHGEQREPSRQTRQEAAAAAVLGGTPSAPNASPLAAVSRGPRGSCHTGATMTGC